jgi:hypothetical protein
MAYSRFDTAQLQAGGKVTVTGPIHFAQDEQLTTVVESLSFVLVQGNVFVHGDGSVNGKGTWSGTADLADKLRAGEPAQGFGVALLVRRATPATPAGPDTPATAASPPVVQMLTWSEAITITT